MVGRDGFPGEGEVMVAEVDTAVGSRVEECGG